MMRNKIYLRMQNMKPTGVYRKKPGGRRRVGENMRNQETEKKIPLGRRR